AHDHRLIGRGWRIRCRRSAGKAAAGPAPRRRSGRRSSCGGRLKLALGFRQAKLARDQAREQSVAKFGEGVAVLLVCVDLLEYWGNHLVERVADIGAWHTNRKRTECLLADLHEGRAVGALFDKVHVLLAPEKQKPR